ncbi:multicopper oxidase domain-containing protein [Thermodesulfobacteriota bacterium]
MVCGNLCYNRDPKWFSIFQDLFNAKSRYELTIAQEKVTIAGKTAEGMTINGNIPGPTLRFEEGDKHTL